MKTQLQEYYNKNNMQDLLKLNLILTHLPACTSVHIYLFKLNVPQVRRVRLTVNLKHVSYLTCNEKVFTKRKKKTK